MHSYALFTVGLIGLCSAQSTISLFLPGLDDQYVMASVITSDATATTYQLACPAGTESDECDIPQNFQFTQGPSTVHYVDHVGYQSEEVGCLLYGTTSASCSVTEWDGVSGLTTDTGLTGAMLAAQFTAVTLTDDLVSSFGSAATTSYESDAAASTVYQSAPAVASQTAMPSVTETSVPTGVRTATSRNTVPTVGTSSNAPVSSALSVSSTPSGPSTQSAATTKTSTGGIPQVTGNSGWVVGGVAVALAVVGL